MCCAANVVFCVRNVNFESNCAKRVQKNIYNVTGVKQTPELRESSDLFQTGAIKSSNPFSTNSLL